MIKIASFDEWQEKSISDTSPDKMVDCPDCNGEGTTYDECSCCGNESVETCIACEGSGTNRFGDLSKNYQKKVFSKENYIKQAIKDITALAEWTAEDRDTLLIESGFTVYNLTYGNKREVITLQE